MKRREVGFLLISLGLTIATVILTFFIITKDLSAFDESIHNWFSSWWIPSLDPLMKVVTFLAHTKTSFILTVIGLSLLFYKKLYHLSFILLSSMGGGVVITYLMKSTIARDRPAEIAHMNIWGLFTDKISYSFPSGHALKGTLIFGVLIYAIHLEMEHKLLKRFLISSLGTIIVLIGVGQILLDRHFASDIMGGYLVALAWLTLCMALTRPVLAWLWGILPKEARVKIEQKFRTST